MECKSKRISPVKHREILLAIVIIVFSIFIQFFNANWLTLGNVSDVLIDTAMLAMLALGMMLVLLTGGIDLSIAAVVSFTAMLAPIVMINNPEMPTFFAFLAAIGCGGAMGLLNGFLIAKGGLIPIIATLGTMNIFRGLNMVIINGYGGWITSTAMHSDFIELSRLNIAGLHIYIWFMIILYIIFFLMMGRTRFGRRIYAVGSNPDAMKISGVNGSAILILVYTICGVIAGFCGPLWAGRYSFAQGDTAQGFEMYVIASCVIGGVSVTGGSGKVAGVFFGSMLIGIIKNALPMLQVSQFWQLFFQGAIILGAVLLNEIVIKRSREKALRERKI